MPLVVLRGVQLVAPSVLLEDTGDDKTPLCSANGCPSTCGCAPIDGGLSPCGTGVFDVVSEEVVEGVVLYERCAGAGIVLCSAKGCG